MIEGKSWVFIRSLGGLSEQLAERLPLVYLTGDCIFIIHSQRLSELVFASVSSNLLNREEQMRIGHNTSVNS